MDRYLASRSVMSLALLIAACGAEPPASTESPNTTPSAGNSATPPTTPSAGRSGSAAPVGTAGRASTTPPRTGASGSTASAGTAAPSGSAGTLANAAGTAGSNVAAAGGGAGAAGIAPGSAGSPAAGSSGTPSTGTGMCCDDGDCICRGEPPTSLTSDEGEFTVESYAHQAGCIYYPTDAEPPFSAVAISDGYGGAGGCGRTQTDGWGRLYASHGIVAMIINTTGGDQPNQRGSKLTRGIAAFKEENENSSSPLHQKLAGRYGTSGFSMGGGGTSFSSADDATLRSSVAVMPYGPTRDAIEVPTLVICGSSDNIASCASHGNRLYASVGDSVPKMRITVSAGHAGQPSAGGGDSGSAGLAFQKVYLDGDQRWKSVLLMVDSNETNIQ